MRNFGLGIAVSAAALVLPVLVGCGGGSGDNNDQGISFRAIGMFRGAESITQGQITCTIPNVQSAISDVSFNLNINTATDFPNRNDPFADPCGGYIQLENLLLNQAINVQEIAIRYEVPGSAVGIPEHSVNSGVRINSASSTQTGSSGLPNVVFHALYSQIVPQAIIVFLNQNENRLPSPPYFMNAFLKARAQSDNGTNYESNEIGYQFTISF